MKKILIAFLLFACLATVSFLMRPSAKKLITHSTPYGILNLELAYNISHTTEVLTAWHYDNRIEVAKENTYFDFAFIFFYSLFLFFVCKNLSNIFSGHMKKIGIILSRAAIVSGCLDVIENSGMLLALTGHSTSSASLITATSSIIKWMLVLLAVVYIIIAGIAAVFVLIKRRRNVVG